MAIYSGGSYSRYLIVLFPFLLPAVSIDQIDFNEEVRKESEEVLEAERIAKEADKKPLWEQLAGKRDEKQAKFDAVRASMFGTCSVYIRYLLGP